MTLPADIVHVLLVATVPPIVQLESAVLNPVPMIVIVSPALPVPGESMIDGGGITVKVAEAENPLFGPVIVIM